MWATGKREGPRSGERREDDKGDAVRKRMNWSRSSRQSAPGETMAYVIIAAISNVPTCQPLNHDPTMKLLETLCETFDLPLSLCLIPGFRLSTRCGQRSALLSPQICSIVVSILFEIPPVAIAYALLRISVKISSVLNGLHSILLHAPFRSSFPNSRRICPI